MPKKFEYFLLLVSFFEGCAVMACELLSAKLVAPYFGSSIYVWAAVIGTSLFALMLGYYLGGYASKRWPTPKLIFYILGLGGILFALLPVSGKAIMASTINMSVQMGVTTSLLIFMFPPILLMGMTSPLIINAINHQIETTGKNAGLIFAISTFGGIITTFLTGFYIMSKFGITGPAITFGLGLTAICAIGLLITKKTAHAIVLLLLGTTLAFISKPEQVESPSYNIIYESEGILGQIKIVEHDFPTATRGMKAARVLLVNNTAQTVMDLENPDYSLWDWSYYFPTAASVFPEESDVLLLGLGGGVLVKQFERLQFNIDVVELDERIKDVAIEYFFVDPATNIVVDDARHYINTCTKKYDLITLDLFLNETPPAHVITVESFSKIKGLLKPGGMIMMNFYGYITGEIGRASRCVYLTLQEAGFDTKLFVTPGAEANRNLIFLGCTDEKDFTNTTYSEPDLPALGDLNPYFLNPNEIDFSDAMVLIDEVPVLEELYASAALDWHRMVNEMYTKDFINEGAISF